MTQACTYTSTRALAAHVVMHIFLRPRHIVAHIRTCAVVRARAPDFVHYAPTAVPSGSVAPVDMHFCQRAWLLLAHIHACAVVQPRA